MEITQSQFKEEQELIKSKIYAILKEHSRDGVFFGLISDGTPKSIIDKEFKVAVAYDLAKFPRKDQ